MAARVSYLNREDLPEAERVIFDNLAAESGGTVGNLFRVLAHTPKFLRRFCSMGNSLRNKTALDPKLRELAILTVGWLTDAQYEFVHHLSIARRVGVSREQLQALAEWEQSSKFNDHERVVIRYAVEATSNVRVTDATWNALKTFLDTQRMMELVQNVAFYNMVVRILEPVGVELEPGATRD